MNVIDQAGSTSLVRRYGNKAVEWQPATLQRVLAQLQSERQQIADTDALLTQAECIKQTVTNQIHEVDAMQ